MDPVSLAKALGLLGIKGIDPTKLGAALSLAEELGGSVSVDSDNLGGYFPKYREGMFIPEAPGEGYYYNPKVLRRLSSVDPGVFRRLLGVR